MIAKHAEVAGRDSEVRRLPHQYELMAGLGVRRGVHGIGLAWYFYLQQPNVPERLAAQTAEFTGLIYNKYYVDQIYDAMFVNRAKDLAVALGAFDVGVISTAMGVNGVGWATRLASSIGIVLGQVGYRRARENGGARCDHRLSGTHDSERARIELRPADCSGRAGLFQPLSCGWPV